MIKTEAMHTLPRNDAELVAESIKGNQDTFRQIVERYQTLICSLAYCATGSLSQSEDLAQETFLTAWKDLHQLREPAKLRSWLCAILRFRISNQFRKQGREPIHMAEPLEALELSAAPDEPPSAQAITNEETALLWRALEAIPEIYREPLVLFYREHQSIETVALSLDLTEDAVKQRLSRGRKILQNHVLAFLQGALVRTNPGPAFTLAVLAVLPSMTFSAKAATLGTAAKAGAATKGGLLGLGSAVFGPLLASVWMWVIYRLQRKAGHSEGELKFSRKLCIAIAVSVAVFLIFFNALISRAGSLIKTNPALFAGLMVGSILGYCLLIVISVVWLNSRAEEKFTPKVPEEIAANSKSPLWEYRSQFELLGLPFIHIRFGGWYGGRMEERLKRRKPLKAWIAVTDNTAIGVLFAYGGLAIAPFSVGAAAIGLFSFGGFALGGLAIGGFGFGIWAIAPFAVGWHAFGDCAIAWNAAWGGQYAVAHDFAVAKAAQAAQTNHDFVRQLLKENPFFQFCRTTMTYARMVAISWVWMIPILISMVLQGWIVARNPHLRSSESGKSGSFGQP